MTPWAGPGAWRSWRDTAWYPEPGGFSRHTGGASKFWRERGGGYYGTTFKGERGVTQSDPLSPTIFNVVVDAVVRHWLMGVIVYAEERVKLGKEGRHQADLFYADDGMVASSDPRWLQGDFNTLVGLFDRVGLRTNVGKTVIMVCHPCQAAGNLLEEVYGRRVTG